MALQRLYIQLEFSYWVESQILSLFLAPPHQFGWQGPTVSLRQQTLSVHGSPSARGVIGEITWRSHCPDIEHRHQQPPGGLHLIGAHEQGRSEEHTSELQSL